MKLVPTLPRPMAIKDQTRMRVAAPPTRALLTSHMRPALHMPLRAAAIVVSNIMPRQVVQINFRISIEV